MTPAALGQLAGLGLASGINLYLTVAVLGLLSRFALVQGLPTGLLGLESWVVILSAAALYLVEAVVDKVPHADSLWDSVHTFIRPPAAGLLAVAALWGQPTGLVVAGSALTLAVALVAHGTKAGGRMALNATLHTRWQPWISVGEDVLAVAVAVLAVRFPVETLVGVGVAMVPAALAGPPLFRAYRLGGRAIGAWLRSLFAPSGWREMAELPQDVQALVDDTPLGAAPPRGTGAAVSGLDGAGSFRNGWLVMTVHGPVFAYRPAFGVTRRLELPVPASVETVSGVWADILRVKAEGGASYTIFLLKDGPEAEMAGHHLTSAAP